MARTLLICSSLFLLSCGSPPAPAGFSGGGGGDAGSQDSAHSAEDSQDDTSVEPDAGDDAPGCEDACEAAWSTACLGAQGLVTCVPGPDGCLVEGPFIACAAGGTCQAGQCLGGCTIPRVVVLADRSAAAQGELSGWSAAAVVETVRRLGGGAAVGLRAFPGDDACTAGPILTPPTTPEEVQQALVAPGGDAPVADALTGLDEALGEPGQGQAVILLLAGSACDVLDDALAAVDALRARGVGVYPIALGLNADAVLLQEIANRSGTEVRQASNQLALENRLAEVFDALAPCCADGDGDLHGPFCDLGPDCNDQDANVFAPSCGQKVCGDDGCGGSCGTCAAVADGQVACDGGQCVLTCDAGYHDCGGACVSNFGPEHCGTSCSPCGPPAGGVAGCNGEACVGVCPGGTHLCDDACVSDHAPAHCGDACEPCPVAPGATATCTDGVCGLACVQGFLECEGACAACPAEAGVATVGCGGATCVASGCADGFVLCGDTCCDTLRVDVDDAGGPSATTGYPEIAVGAMGNVHIAYHRVQGEAGQLRYATGAFETWATEIVSEALATDHGRFARLTLDGPGQPHLAFRGGFGAGSAVIRHAEPAGGAWALDNLADTTGPWPYQVTDFDLAVTLNGVPAVVYPSAARVAVAVQTGGAPSQTSVVQKAGATYASPAALYDAEGMLHLVFVEDAKKLRYASGGATTWAVEDVDITLSGLGQQRIGLAMAGAERVVCYFNYAAGSLGLNVATSTGLGWTHQDIDDLGEQACSVAFGPTGPVIAYRRLGGSLGLALQAPGGAWLTEELEPAGGPAGLRWPSLAFGKDGSMHLAAFAQDSQTLRYFYRP